MLILCTTSNILPKEIDGAALVFVSSSFCEEHCEHRMG